LGDWGNNGRFGIFGHLMMTNFSSNVRHSMFSGKE
jgi:hypothetical protein